MQIIGILIAIILLTALVLMVEVDEHEQEELRLAFLENNKRIRRPATWLPDPNEATELLQD